MNTIDFHVHLIPPDAYHPEVLEFLDEVNPGYARRFELGYPRPADLVAELREQGVSRAVVLAEHASATTGFLASERVAEYCRGHDELIPAASVNPNQDANHVAMFERFVHELGMRVLKILPSYQFYYPNEGRMYPVYRIAEQYHVPMLVHVGSSRFRGTRRTYCDPLYLEDVARDFPALPILLSHAGRGYWYDECAFMAAHHDNVFIDVAGLPPRKLLEYLPSLPKIAHKVVFGSDWPGIPRTISENVRTIQALPLPDAAIEAILWRNAEQLLEAAQA